MSHAVNIPKLGLTMEEATLVEWHVSDGQKVVKGVPLLTIETDKIMFDIEAEADGYVQRIAPVDSRLAIGQLVAWLNDTPQAVGATVPEPPAAQQAAQVHPAVIAVNTANAAGDGARLLVSPVARVLAQERGVSLHTLRGSGPGGVILKRDVPEAVPAVALAPVAPMPAAVADVAASVRRPLTSMRRAISQRMMHSLSSSAQMTGFGRVDMGEAVTWRDALVANATQLGARITYTDLVLKVAACALRDVPELNAYIDGDDIVSLRDVDIGLAVAVDGGLMVPVLRQVDRLSLVDISQQRQELIERARAGRLGRGDVEGGSFTLSNFGSYGGDFETPILNAPQSALLGIGRISDEPVVRDKQIVIRPVMMMSLTFDHRLIDGAVAGRFRARVRELLEQPALLAAQLR